MNTAFFDTNIIVYSHDRRAGLKQARAIELIESHVRSGQLVISTQVLIESFNALQRAALLTLESAFEIVQALADERVVAADAASVMRALALARRYRLSHWDALVVQAALDARCATLFTEDLQAGQRFGGLEVVNPFAEAAHEPHAGYSAVAPRARKTVRKRAKR